MIQAFIFYDPNFWVQPSSNDPAYRIIIKTDGVRTDDRSFTASTQKEAVELALKFLEPMNLTAEDKFMCDTRYYSPETI